MLLWDKYNVVEERGRKFTIYSIEIEINIGNGGLVRSCIKIQPVLAVHVALQCWVSFPCVRGRGIVGGHGSRISMERVERVGVGMRDYINKLLWHNLLNYPRCYVKLKRHGRTILDGTV